MLWAYAIVAAIHPLPLAPTNVALPGNITVSDSQIS